MEILAQIDHPNIVKLIEVFDEPTKFYMVMEIMTGLFYIILINFSGEVGIFIIATLFILLALW